MKPMRWWSEHEDGHPGRPITRRTLHHEGSADEHVRTEIVSVRIPRTSTRMTLVQRDYQRTGETKFALEVIRVESPRT